MNSDSLNMVSRLGEGHMPCTFFLSEPQLKITVSGHAKLLLVQFAAQPQGGWSLEAALKAALASPQLAIALESTLIEV